MAAHSWPYRWYVESIDAARLSLPACDSPLTYWGFARAPLAQASGLTIACAPDPNWPAWLVQGNDPLLLPDGVRRETPTQFVPGVLLNTVISPTGTVEVIGGVVRLYTGSPAWVRLTFSLPHATEFIRFSYQFTSPGASAVGRLTLSTDEVPIVEAIEADNVATVLSSGPVYLRRTFGPGSVTAEFRLDPLTASQSSIEITGIEFGVPVCYANCDGSSGVPALTGNDFQCFLDKFAGQDPYANCDGSTGTPTLTANDFQCFLNKYAAGCP
jgi:hypothetical protein